MSGASQLADAPPPGKRSRLQAADKEDSTSNELAAAAAGGSSAGDSANAKAIKSMLESIGPRQSHWLYLVEDRLKDDEGEAGDARSQGSVGGKRAGQRALDFRRTLRRYYRASTETKRWSIMISRLSSRMDLQRNAFSHPADADRFNVGTWVDDPHNDDAITIIRTKTYTGTASSSFGNTNSAPSTAESAANQDKAVANDSAADTAAAPAVDNNAKLAATLDAFDF
eukprot:INCI12957.1.p1 GENE.INCI12957.1~~INCI12957.1.p1  ORF type:complete len:226 (-),score=47.62 INCI12957.1:166-843(-)